jgi:hypothetical protein
MIALLLVLALGAEQIPDTPESPDLARIRRALEQSRSVDPLSSEPTFRVTTEEHTPLLRSAPPPDLSGGPRPPGGLYAFEQRQRLGNAWAGQAWISVDVLPVAEWIAELVRSARRASLEHSAQREVSQALAEFCAVHECTPGK